MDRGPNSPRPPVRVRFNDDRAGAVTRPSPAPRRTAAAARRREPESRPPRPPSSRPGGWVACVVRDGGDWELALYDVDTGEALVLTRGGSATPVTRPLPSPDGRRIAYFASDGSVRVREVATGGAERAVARPGGPPAMAWSPDGRRLAMDGLEIVDAATGERRRAGAGGRWPQWLPDGRHLLFARDFHIWLLDLARDVAEPVTTGPPLPRASLRLAPSGRWLAYATPDAPLSRLRVIDLATRGEAGVETLGEEDIEPCWARHPPLLAFVALEPTGSGEAPGARLRVADPSGVVVRDVARLDMPLGTAVTWSPDGRHLAAVQHVAGVPRLCLFPVDGRSPRVVHALGEARHPSWSVRAVE